MHSKEPPDKAENDGRFKEVYNLLRDQAIQIKEQRDKIEILETQIHNQNQRCQLESIHEDLKIRMDEIESLKNIVNRQQKELTAVKKQLATMTSRQIKCETNSMKLMEIISKQQKDCCDRKHQTRTSSTKTTALSRSHFKAGNSLKNDRGRRLLIRTATTVSPPMKPTAFYAYLSHHELTSITTIHSYLTPSKLTIIVGTVRLLVYSMSL